MHPMGKVPILKDGDLIVPDSSVICAYLERSRPGRPMYPAGAADYARALSGWHQPPSHWHRRQTPHRQQDRPPCSCGHHPRRQIYVLGLADEIIDYGALDFPEVLSNCDVVFDTVGGARGPDAPLPCSGGCFYLKSGPPAPQGAQWTDLSRKTGL